MSADTRAALVERLRQAALGMTPDNPLPALLREAADQLAAPSNEHEYQLIAAAVGERGMTDASTPLYIRLQNLVEHWDKLAAPVGETGWQPIATAPTDGTQVWLFVPRYGMGRVPFVMVQGWNLAADRRGWRSHYAGGIVEPTHWRPLPEAPTNG